MRDPVNLRRASDSHDGWRVRDGWRPRGGHLLWRRGGEVPLLVEARGRTIQEDALLLLREVVEAAYPIAFLDFHERIALHRHLRDVRQRGQPANLRTLFDDVIPEVDPLKSVKTLEPAYRLQPVVREVECNDTAEISVDAEDGVNHVVGEVEIDKIIEGGQARGNGHEKVGGEIKVGHRGEIREECCRKEREGIIGKA